MTRPAADRSALRRVVERVEVDAVLARMERGLLEMPAYARFVAGGVVLDDRGRAAIRWNLELFLRWLADGRPPGDAAVARLRELVRVRAAEGLPIEEGLLVYRRGARLGWDALVEAAGDDRTALLEGADVFFEYVALISDVFAQAYAAQRDSPMSNDERRARALLDRLRAQAPLGAEEHELSERMAFPLAAAYRPFVLMLVGGSVRRHVETAARLRRAGALAATDGPRVSGLTHVELAWESLGLGAGLLVADGPPTPRDALAGALEELRALVGIAQRAGRRGRVERDAFLPAMLLHAAPPIAERLATRVFGALDASGRPELAATLAAFVAHDFDRAATAAALHVHRNTLRYRLERIAALTGLDLDRADDRGLAWLACLARAG